MEIREIDFSQVNPAPYNPRKDLQPGDPDFEKLEKSIEEFGLVQLLVYNDRTGNLVGGHQTLKVLKEKGENRAKMSVVDLPLKKEKQLNLALNKIEGEWDTNQLAILIDELNDDIDDMALTGFDNEEIDKLMDEIQANEDMEYLDSVMDEVGRDSREESESSEEESDYRETPKTDIDFSSLRSEHRTKLKESMNDEKKRNIEENSDYVVEDNGDDEDIHFVNLSFSLTPEQRDFAFDVINLIKQEYEDKGTQLEAFMKMCEITDRFIRGNK